MVDFPISAAQGEGNVMLIVEESLIVAEVVLAKNVVQGCQER